MQDTPNEIRIYKCQGLVDPRMGEIVGWGTVHADLAVATQSKKQAQALMSSPSGWRPPISQITETSEADAVAAAMSNPGQTFWRVIMVDLPGGGHRYNSERIWRQVN